MAGAVPLLPTHAFIEWVETSPLYERPHKSRKTPTGFFISFCLPVPIYACMSASPAGRIFVKFGFCENIL